MKIDAEKVTDHLVRFIKDTVTGAEKDGVVLGLSGGVDSAVVAMLALKALGPHNVLGLWLPSEVVGMGNLADANSVAIEIDHFPLTIPIGMTEDKRRRGNIYARLRMIVLYDKAAETNRLVIGTSNKSEIMLGYGTLHGDTACDLNPIGGLYKTQVYQLAEYLGVPRPIIEKPPSADLWPGQTDEGELGFSYEVIDPVLEAIERHHDFDAIGPYGTVQIDTVKKIHDSCRRNAFKRRGPLVASIP